jgi:hypothetical protein
MKNIFKKFMILSLGLAVLATGCKKDEEEDLVAGLNGNYTAEVLAKIGTDVVYPIAQLGDPAELPFKVENATGSEFTITGSLTLNALTPGLGGAVINVALQATNAQVTKEELLGVPVYAGTFSIPAQTININFGGMSIPVSIAASNGAIALSIIVFSVEGTLTTQAGSQTVTIEVSMFKN